MFFYEYDNLQYQATDPELFQGGVGNVLNRIYGAEIEQGVLTDSLVYARIALLETEITASILLLTT